ncbi:MAG: 4-hydroxy-3-methylbut-2-enyl diphosphate reductase [Dehalococcoidales bacterium]|nr:4-hydroxy-3-methylbut-2-enyl diphosphate reductase [Dehalococcoidales bacterium]
MKYVVRKAARTGFCFGVKKAVETLEKVAQIRGRVEPLGAVVHNRQVMKRLSSLGVQVADSLDDITGNTVAIGAHGVSPEMENEIRTRFSDVINTTCPFVQRAQMTARRLSKSGFFVIIFGDGNHREVKGILGWAENHGMATLDTMQIQQLPSIPRRIGIISQTTQVPADFNRFAGEVFNLTYGKDSEIRIIDTICHDIRERQQATIDLAKNDDLMLVIGSNTSANSNHLAKMCSAVTEARLIESSEEISPSLLDGHHTIGVTGGASTDEAAIQEVIDTLKSF